MAACKLLANLDDPTEASSLLDYPGVLCEVSGDTNSEHSNRSMLRLAVSNCEVYDV